MVHKYVWPIDLPPREQKFLLLMILITITSEIVQLQCEILAKKLS